METPKSSSPLGREADRVRTDIRLPPEFRAAVGERCKYIGIPLGTFAVLAIARLVSEMDNADVGQDQILDFLERQFSETVSRIRARARRQAQTRGRSKPVRHSEIQANSA